MGVGSPERLIDELVRQRKSNLLVIGNDAGTRERASASWWTRHW